MSKSKNNSGVHIGSSSILMIFVLLCLISFATLSIVSANADYKLSSKVLERTTAYYDACNEAEQALADIDRTLKSVYEQSNSLEDYYSAVGHHKSYNIPTSDEQFLQVEIEILYPKKAGDCFYRVTKWHVVNLDDGVVEP